MTQSDQMLEFIDGTLGVPQEQELFEQLAAHPELRTELRHYVQIGDAVRADREAFAPPADVERRLLGGLGLLPIGSAVAGAGGAAAGGLAGAALLKGGLLHLLGGFLLGALLVGGGVWYTLGGSDDAGPSVAVSSSGVDNATARQSESLADPSGTAGRGIAQGNELADGGTAPTSVAPSPSGGANRRTSPYIARRHTSLSKRSIVDPGMNTNGDGESRLDAMDSQGVNDNRGMVHTPDRRTVELRAASPRESAQSVVSPSAFRSAEESGNDGGGVAPPDFSPQPLVFEREPTTSQPVASVMYRKLLLNDPIVDNRALQGRAGGLDAAFGENFIAGGYYPASGSLQFGIEFGRERYAQSFFYNREDSLVIEQRPVLGWGGFAARLNTTDLLPIPVELGTTLGFSQHGGPVARGVLSVNLLDLLPGVDANDRLSFPFGLEASSLVYTVNDQYFVSGNWGLSGGVRIGL